MSALVLIMVLVAVLLGALAWWYLGRDDDDKPPPKVGSGLDPELTLGVSDVTDLGSVQDTTTATTESNTPPFELAIDTVTTGSQQAEQDTLQCSIDLTMQKDAIQNQRDRYDCGSNAKYSLRNCAKITCNDKTYYDTRSCQRYYKDFIYHSKYYSGRKSLTTDDIQSVHALGVNDWAKCGGYCVANEDSTLFQFEPSTKKCSCGKSTEELQQNSRFDSNHKWVFPTWDTKEHDVIIGMKDAPIELFKEAWPYEGHDHQNPEVGITDAYGTDVLSDNGKALPVSGLPDFTTASTIEDVF